MIKLAVGGTVHSKVLIAAAGAKLRDSLDTNVQGFQLLSGDALRHSFPEVLHQQSHAAFLRQREGVKNYTFLAVKGPQRADRVSEAIGG
jgi:hypothetical protein